MAAGTVENAVGVVTLRRTVGEDDLIIHIAAYQKGNLALYVRRGRRAKAASTYEVGNLVEVEYLPRKKGLALLKGAERLFGPSRSRASLPHLALVLYCCEVTEALLSPAQGEDKLVKLLAVAIEVLETKPNPKGFQQAFEAKVLTFAGFTPNLIFCGLCAQPLYDPVNWAVADGGGIHERCGSGAPTSIEHLHLLEQLRRTPLSEVKEGVANDLLHRFLVHHLGRRPKASDWFDEITP